MEVNLGTILAFYGGMSGLGHLQIVDENGANQMIPCDNGPTVRALDSAFGDVIAPGHTVSPSGGHVNEQVYWWYDDIGLVMAGFCPVDEASDELIEMYESEGEHECDSN